MSSRVSIISSCEYTGKAIEGYDAMCVRMVYSLRKNAGALKDAPVFLWYDIKRPPRTAYAKALEGMGCVLVPGKCFMPEQRMYNKLTAMSIEVETEYALWLDSDIFIVGDLEHMLEGSPDISASPTTYCHHKWANLEDKPSWDEFYLATGLINPDIRITTDLDGKQGLFYLCSGVVLFKSSINFPYIYGYCANNILNTSVPGRFESFSQTALALAVVEGGFQFKKLEERFQVVYALRKEVFPDTAIVHYQDNRVTEVSDLDWSAGGILSI